MASILYAVSNATTPNTEEQALQTFMEGLGHTVTRIQLNTVPDFTGHDMGSIGPHGGVGMTGAGVREGWIAATVPVIVNWLSSLVSMGLASRPGRGVPA